MCSSHHSQTQVKEILIWRGPPLAVLFRCASRVGACTAAHMISTRANSLVAHQCNTDAALSLFAELTVTFEQIALQVRRCVWPATRATPPSSPAMSQGFLTY